jgi:hypothetical protein
LLILGRKYNVYNLQSIVQSIDKYFPSIGKVDIEYIRRGYSILDQVAINREVVKVLIDIFKYKDLKITKLYLYKVSIETVVLKLSKLLSRTLAGFTSIRLGGK